MNNDFTVFTSEQEERLRKLEEFYAEIRKIAVECNLNEVTRIYNALSKMNPNWKYTI